MNICLLTFSQNLALCKILIKIRLLCGQKSTCKKTRGFVVDYRIKREVNKKTNTLCFISWPIKEPETIVFLAQSHTFPCFRWKKCFLLPWLALLQYEDSRGHYWVQSVFSIQNIQIRVKEINRYNFPPIKDIRIQVAVRLSTLTQI